MKQAAIAFRWQYIWSKLPSPYVCNIYEASCHLLKLGGIIYEASCHRLIYITGCSYMRNLFSPLPPHWLATLRNDWQHYGMIDNTTEWLATLRNDWQHYRMIDNTTEWLTTLRNDWQHYGMIGNTTECIIVSESSEQQVVRLTLNDGLVGTWLTLVHWKTGICWMDIAYA